MTPKPLILLTSPGLSSYVMLADVIRTYPHLIRGIVQLPFVPPAFARSDGRTRSRLSGVVKHSGVKFVAFQWLITYGYVGIARLCRRDAVTLARRQRIPVCSFSDMDEAFCRQLAQWQPEWIINTTAFILTDKVLRLARHGVLNYHGAPLPAYRGAANYIWMLVAGARDVTATVHMVNAALDAGDIVQRSRPVTIQPGMSVFALWYAMRRMAFDCWQPVFEKIAAGEPLPREPQDPDAGVCRSFPSRRELQMLKQKGHPLMRWHDVMTITGIACRGRSFASLDKLSAKE